MSFSRIKDALDFIARLPDRPTLAQGYSCERLKAEFDKGAQALKDFLNGVLLKELEANGAGSSAAEHLGSAAIEGLSGITVHAQIAALKTLADALRRDLNAAATGEIPDGSLGEEKLSQELKELLQCQNRHGLQRAAYTQNGAYTFTAPLTGNYRFCFAGAGGGGSLANPQGKPVGSYACHGGPAGACGELIRRLEKGQRVSLIVGKGGVPYQGFALGQSLSSVEYDGTYLAQRLDSSPGENTEVIFSGTQRVVAEGGDRTAGPVGVRSYGMEDAVMLSHRGASENPWGGQWCSVGADSFLGQGGKNGNPPGIGGGGQGGRLRFEEDGQYTVEALPYEGGDGAVWIEYVGGE